MDPNLLVSVLVLAGTVVLIALTLLMVRTRQPSFRLDRIIVNPWSPFEKDHWMETGKPIPVRLIFVNDGPGMAPATTITAVGLPLSNPEPIRFPRDSSPTLQPGGEVEVDFTFPTIAADGPWPERNFAAGDDIRLDLRGLQLVFEWQHGKKRTSWTLSDVHAVQRSAPVLVEEQGPGLFG